MDELHEVDSLGVMVLDGNNGFLRFRTADSALPPQRKKDSILESMD
jgi:hypothetical protein